MNSEVSSQGAAVSKPPTEVLEKAPLSGFRNYAALSRNFHEQTVTNLCYQRKSQTVSGESKNLSAPSRELRGSKIQTPSGQFRRRCLRNLESTATRALIAGARSFDISRVAHPPTSGSAKLKCGGFFFLGAVFIRIFGIGAGVFAFACE